MPTSAFRFLPFLWLCLALAPAAAAAQGAVSSSSSPLRALGAASVGLRTTADGLRGGGPDYRVEFDGAGMRFTPALGRAAERTLPVSFELESVSVGGVALPCAPGLPQACGTEVRYSRGGGLTERYELTAEGVEQSFVFESLPAGRGELVVRGRFSTELAVTAADERAGLVLAHGELGGVRYGGVTGIDAEGRSAAGWLRLDGDVLELGLPADFVAGAALPLVLDPLISPLLTLDDSAYNDTDVDVAFDPDGRYLVVWARAFSSGDVEIRGQRVNEDGTLAGGLLYISSSGDNRLPAAGTIQSGHSYLVAWEHRSDAKPGADIYVAAVASDGSVSSEFPVGVSADEEIQPDVGRGWTGCPVIWSNVKAGINGATVELDVFGDPTVTSLYAVSSNPADRSPSLSPTDSFYVHAVWLRDAVFTSDSILGRRWGSAPTTSNPEFLIHAGGASVLSSPACAEGEHGDDLMVVWANAEPVPPGKRDVHAARVTFADTDPLVHPYFAVEKDAAQDDRAPAIVYAKHSYVVAFLASDTADYVQAVSIDGMSGARLEQMLVAGPSKLGPPALGGVADTYTFGDPPDGVLIALTGSGAGGGDVLASLAEGIGGTQFELYTAGCAGAGSARASAFHSPNTGHREELWNATGSAGLDAFVGLGWAPFSLPLGEATLVLDPAQSLIVYGGTVSADGYVGVKVPIPAGLAGATLWSQWALIPSAAPCTSLGINLSDGLQSVIE